VEWREKIGRESLAQEYRQASVLLHLARYESFGLPFIEAAAFGAPVVTTPVGIAPELLTGDLRRFLVDGDDAEAVAHALAVAEAEKGRIGAALRQRYERSYTRDRMTEDYLHILAISGGKTAHDERLP
jgi:glycosyltransferase involved in cell wall biosynthesis